MPEVKLRPAFSKDLISLKSNSRKNYQRVCEILTELPLGTEPTAPRRAESRIPNCVKYELADGYRLVFQVVRDSDTLIALTVGKHDHVDSFLDGHKGFVFDVRTGRIKELRLATIEETSVAVVPSIALSTDNPQSATDSPSTQQLFDSFTDEMLARLGIASSSFASLRRISDPNSLECMEALTRIEEDAPTAATLLLAYATGNADTHAQVLAVALGAATHLAELSASDLPAVEISTEEFLTVSEPAELAHILDKGTFAEWQLFLHPDQRSLVTREFAGPARLRGISGSGKTVVALHRARRLAQGLRGTKRRVLFTTFDKSLATEAGRLLDTLCGSERANIEVTHLHRWCLDYIGFVGLRKPRFSPEASREIKHKAVAALPTDYKDAIQKLPEEYLWSEIEFLMGRFLHEDRQEYLTTERAGRGIALTGQQRQAVLTLYETYHQRLFDAGFVEPSEFVRMAFRQRKNGDPTEYDYAAVILDEVQDISELGLRLMHSVVGDRADGLLMVGDNAQRIFTRGYSLRGLGIDIQGRSLVLRKNYRNTRQILEAAFPLVAAEWDADVRVVGTPVEDTRPEYSVREGHRPLLVRCHDDTHEEAFIAAEVSALLRYRHYSPRDICVVARNKRYRELALSGLAKAHIPATQYQRQSNGDESGDADAVRVCSLHAVKGHEYGAVFIVGATAGVLPQSHPGDPEGEASERSLLYVAMTRARDIVYLSFAAHKSNGAQSPRSPLIEEISSRCDLCTYQPHGAHPFVPPSALGFNQ